MILHRIPVLFLFLFSLLFFTACEYWEDIWDGDKPPPDTPLASTVETQKIYTREEAVDHIVHKLIMRFSRYEQRPSVKLPPFESRLSYPVFEKLLDAHAVGTYKSVRFEEKSKDGKILFRAIDESTGKILYEETFDIKKNHI